MTKTVIISKTGGPEVLELKDFKIKSPGPSEVLIEHKAIGLNFIDIYHRSGLYPIDTPSGIGAEAAGVIKEVGDKIHDFNKKLIHIVGVLMNNDRKLSAISETLVVHVDMKSRKASNMPETLLDRVKSVYEQHTRYPIDGFDIRLKINK